MRKSNSIFKTAFVSEAGGQLVNNDYFAYIELDDYGCYVIASGITDFQASEAAKEVVEHLLLSFEEKPSMAKATLAQYMKEANQRLLHTNSKQRLKATVMMVVTDYESFRYVSAGNIHLRMYRNGRIFLTSSDMSLAQDMISKGNHETSLEKHEERNNLYAYVGKADFFHPQISKKVKLMDADIISFYTRGIWENIDENEIDELFSEAADEPQESVDYMEDLLLSRQAKNQQCYTLVSIFVNKVYRDPEREHKRLRYMKIAILVFVVILLIAIIAFVLNWRHGKKVAELNDHIERTIYFMQADNYVRAQEVCKTALEEAEQISTKKAEAAQMRDYMLLIDSILLADDDFRNKDYAVALDDYLTALDNSRNADNMGQGYIERRIAQVEEHLTMEDFLRMGDEAMKVHDLPRAEDLYYQALKQANLNHSPTGRAKALEALGNVFDALAADKKTDNDKMDKASKQAVSDALNKGDQLMQAGDYDGAQAAYLQARTLSNSIGDREGRTEAMNSLTRNMDAEAKAAVAKDKDNENYQRLLDQAVGAANKGDAAFLANDYASAQAYYTSAMEKYNSLFDTTAAASMRSKADTAATKLGETIAQKNMADSVAQQARDSYAAGNFADAKQQALQAKQLYTGMSNQSGTDEMQRLIEQVDTDAAIAAGLQ